MDELNLTELRNQCLASLYTCAENVSKYSQNEDWKVAEYNRLKNCVKEYCKMEHQDEAGKKAIQLVEQESDTADWDSLQQIYQEKLTQFTKSRAKYDNHHFMKELERHIQNAERSLQVQDMDLAITEAIDTYTDPISKTQIKNPMRNTICKHVYEKETIENYILKNKKNRGCPYVGCTNKQMMKAQHLEFDEELQLTIQQGTQQSSQEW